MFSVRLSSLNAAFLLTELKIAQVIQWNGSVPCKKQIFKNEHEEISVLLVDRCLDRSLLEPIGDLNRLQSNFYSGREGAVRHQSDKQ